MAKSLGCYLYIYRFQSYWFAIYTKNLKNIYKKYTKKIKNVIYKKYKTFQKLNFDLEVLNNYWPDFVEIKYDENSKYVYRFQSYRVLSSKKRFGTTV